VLQEVTRGLGSSRGQSAYRNLSWDTTSTSTRRNLQHLASAQFSHPAEAGRRTQAMFPTARFVMVTRHPLAVSLSHKRWPCCGTMALGELVNHWITQHRLMLQVGLASG
jgi:hypothetical protein